ncbi:hypothetical protein PWT90_01123 [Aphanocladium album]|nr:hypothetical protein PWT90_01123 [Aphanocladium album]
MSPEDRELWEKAVNAIDSERKLAANLAAGDAYRRWSGAREAARASLPPQDYKLMFLSMNLPWQKHVLKMGEDSKVGLVLYFPDRPEWPTFKTEIDRYIQTGLTFVCGKVHPIVQRLFAFHWVQGDGSPAELQSKYRALADLPHGVRSDCFLYVDDESLGSREATKPFVWLREPAAALGPLKVDIRHICPALFARLTQRDLPAGEAHEQPFTTSPHFEGFHLAASHAEAGDRIWPPFYLKV